MPRTLGNASLATQVLLALRSLGHFITLECHGPATAWGDWRTLQSPGGLQSCGCSLIAGRWGILGEANASEELQEQSSHVVFSGLFPGSVSCSLGLWV